MKRANSAPPGQLTCVGERGPELIVPIGAPSVTSRKRRTLSQTAFFAPSIVAYYMATVAVMWYSAGAVAGVVWALIGAPFAFLIVAHAVREQATDAEKGAES